MRRFAIAALALLLTGCLGDTTAPSASDLSGTWVITAVNDHALPYSFPNGTTLTSGQMQLEITGAYTSLEHYSNGVDYAEEGGYTIFGIDIVFTDATRGQQYGARYDGGTLTKTAGSYRFTYHKQ